ncbi:MAG: type II secretion system protein [Lachnospiraceae bacterium]|nr:type II secretion system protein [Lachnospiraceae bacterium]
MKKSLKCNKGFSLVELIVVVLIMAIIAVALAPQVMKWVGHSRTSTDASTYDTVVENIQLALADETVLADLKVAGDATYSFKMTKEKLEIPSGAPDSLKTKLGDVAGSTTWNEKVKRKDGGSDYEIELVIKDGNASVNRKTPPETDNVKQ